MKVNRNPTSFSTTDQLCGKKPIFPTPTLRALLRATLLSAWSENKFFLAASSTTVFTTRFHRRHFLGPRSDESCSAAQLRHTSKLSLPTIEFASGPRSPQPQAATSKRLYRTRKELLAHVHSAARARIRH